MDDLHKRVERLEFDTLSRRIEELENHVKGLVPSRSFLSVLKEFLPLLTPIIVALIGLYATAVIKGAIQERQLDLSELTAIRELMVKLAAPGNDLETAEATAVALSAFGTPAIVPLIHELQATGQIRPLAAERGLRTLAFKHTDEVCSTLVQVLEDRSRLFDWKTHRRTITLIGQIGCSEAEPVLFDFQSMFDADDAVTRYRPRVSEVPEPNPKAISSLKRSVADALARLGS